MEELEEELEEESEGPSTVSIMEARSSALTSTGVNFEEPGSTAGAAGPEDELAVLSMEATVSTLETKSSSSTLMGARVEEPWIAVDAGRGVVLEFTVLFRSLGSGKGDILCCCLTTGFMSCIKRDNR